MAGKRIDACLYNGEDVLFDLRLKSLDADIFVVVESDRTFQGDRRELTFNFNDPRIQYHAVSLEPCQRAWDTEDAIRRFLFSVTPKYGTVFWNDIDEFWPAVDVDSPIAFNSKLFYYKFNLYRGQWGFMRACPGEALTEDIRSKAFPSVDGGWHYSYLMTPEQMAQKIRSFSHTECRQYADVEHITRCVQGQKDLYGRSCHLRRVELDGPEYLLNNRDKYREWILD